MRTLLIEPMLLLFIANKEHLIAYAVLFVIESILLNRGELMVSASVTYREA